MTTARYVNELAQGSRVDGDYALRTKELRMARTGDAYLYLVLADRSGSLPGVFFRPPRAAVEIPSTSVVHVRGKVTAFKGARRVMIEQLQPARSWDAEQLVASSVRSSEELISEFATLAKQVSDSRLRQLLRAVFGDKEFFRAFCACPATQSDHHCYLGGLLEHTVAVAGLSLRLPEQYGTLDRDLLLTAALLHDIGTVDSLRFDTGILQTDEGRLIGHAFLGAYRAKEAAGRARLDHERSVRLQHAILSHHDTQRTTAPGPLSLEAFALGNADTLDAQLTGFTHLVEGAVRADEKWTDDQNVFRRALFASSGAGTHDALRDRPTAEFTQRIA